MSLKNINQEISKTAKEDFEKTKEDFSKAKDKAVEIKDDLGEKLHGAGETVGEKFHEAGQNTSNFFAKQEQKIGGAMEHGGESLEKHAQGK